MNENNEPVDGDLNPAELVQGNGGSTRSRAMLIRSLALTGIFILMVLYTMYFAASLILPITVALLLNLIFSTQAAYAAPLILLAQNRQDARDRALAERDREVNERILADTEFLSRELAAIRLRLEAVATTDELDEIRQDLLDAARGIDDS